MVSSFSVFAFGTWQTREINLPFKKLQIPKFAMFHFTKKIVKVPRVF